MTQKVQVVSPANGQFGSRKLRIGDLPPSKILGKFSVEEGNLLFYFHDKPFSLNVLLLNKKNSEQIIWHSKEPIWQSKEKIDPLKVTLNERVTTVHFKIQNKLQTIEFPLENFFCIHNQKRIPQALLHRVSTNPILQPKPENEWESRYVFNSAALYLGDKVHFLYRAIGSSGLSVFGHATSRDGIHIDERSNKPAYICSNSSSSKTNKQNLSAYAYASGGSWSGCEDPRLTKVGNKIYMTYTAFSDWGAPPGVALTSISVNDFLAKNWNWQKPTLISPPNEMHKNWVIFPEKIKGKFAILHSVSPTVLVDYFENLDFDDGLYINSHYQSSGREGHWDNWVRGVGAPPIKTTDGWLVLYHAMDSHDPNRYKIGAMLLSLQDPTKILYRSSSPLLQPDAQYENEGYKAGVVYSCGAVTIGENLFVYYGGADTVVCAAFINLHELITELKNAESYNARQTLPLRDLAKEKRHMLDVIREKSNPFLLPEKEEFWQSIAAFNPCIVKNNGDYHLFYRAQSSQKNHLGVDMSVSSIGYGKSKDGIHFSARRQLIKPEKNWERFGCEDPRVTKFGDRYYIFYTALSAYPFEAKAIRIGVAITKDFETIEEKHLATPFNSKAMALFPEKINGKYAAILTVDTDLPPAKIAVALFDEINQIWSETYWEEWKNNLSQHVIPLLRDSKDHLEVGAAPVKTEHGWLLIYSYIQNYFSSENRVFGIEAVLLDINNPLKVIGRTKQPLLVPEEQYELLGDVPNVIFPSGALLENEQLSIYYGAADTTCCAATLNVNKLLKTLIPQKDIVFSHNNGIAQEFQRFEGNPIISPRPEFLWEAEATFNPAVVYEAGKFHIIYRAMSPDGTSVFGYASSSDGVHIDERSIKPIYKPKEHFEQKLRPGNSGCEDPRITKMGDRYYLFYTAFDGYTPRVAFTSISIEDFLNKHWNWEKGVVITPPNIDDKDACLLSKKINGKYVIFHRANDCIRISYVDSLHFDQGQYLEHGGYVIKPRKKYWDNQKFGIAAPPIETKHGWLLFFHRVTTPDGIYKIEALLLDLNNPVNVIAETDATLIEPEMDYEKFNHVSNVVFPCGNVLLNDEVYLYYGGADRVVGVAKMGLNEIFKRLGL